MHRRLSPTFPENICYVKFQTESGVGLINYLLKTIGSFRPVMNNVLCKFHSYSI